jgi:hypothetical protein
MSDTKARVAGIAALAQQLGSPDPNARRNASFALKNAAREEDVSTAMPSLVKAIWDPDPGVREDVLYVIGRSAENGADIRVALPALSEALFDENPNARAYAALTFMVAFSKGTNITFAMPSLAHAVCDFHTDVSVAAAETLMNAAARKETRGAAISALVGALGDQKLIMHITPAHVLEKILEKCDSGESLDARAAELRKGYAAIRRKPGFRKTGAFVRMRERIFELMSDIARKKNELAAKRDILLDEKPKPPKAGTNYQQVRAKRALARGF